MKRTSEQAFEAVADAHLLANGYESIAGDGFDRNRAIFPETVLAFIRGTQPKEWAKLVSLHGDKTGEQILGDLCKWMDIHGSLATLRHGFKCYGRTLRAAYFKAAHELNPELEARYAANRLGLTRQLHFSPRSEQSLDVTLSLNGIPVATLELKNPLTGQRVEDARRQYKQDRDPREPIFEFKRRTLVHFAVDTESVLKATRLAGAATHSLPFDKGCAGAAGNPPDPAGRTYRTAYLWEEVLERDSLLDLLARFIHLQIDEKRDDEGRKVKAESMIFPRYHQLEAVRLRVDGARGEGAGHSYLVEHSAGSGKSNTIGWLTHRLASLHDAANERVFDSVIVVTDRVVLDQQLQDTIYQFEHKRGVVQRIDESSRQLAEALENAVPVIITTLQKFPFVSRQLLKMAEERGATGTGTLATRRCAVIVDEAHSSQGGETATDLKEVLGGEELREEARKRASEEGREDMEELFRSMAKRGKQANLSFFAFTATPKHKTLAVFGRDGRPAHRYTMRQAIEEEFILDVLKHYTTYGTYFGLLKACEDDPNVERKKAALALSRFMRLHPHNIAQKTEVMVEHFQAVTRHKIGGRAKAMVVTGSRLEAVRYKQGFDRYIQEKGYAIKSLVAFSGTVVDDKLEGVTYTEPGMNHGISEKELPEKFATQEYQVLRSCGEVPDRFRSAAPAHDVRGQAARGHPGGADFVPVEPRSPAQGRHVRSRLRERQGGDSRSLQDLLRRRRDGRGSRPHPHVRDQERAGCFRNLPRRGGRAVQRRLLHAEAAAECVGSPDHECGSRSRGVTFHGPPGRQRGGGGRLARQGAGVPEPVWVPEPGDSVPGLGS